MDLDLTRMKMSWPRCETSQSEQELLQHLREKGLRDEYYEMSCAAVCIALASQIYRLMVVHWQYFIA